MAKAVRWQIPFQSIDGTNYRIDIYDEGFSGTPVQLTGAQNVLTTTEDTDSDFFAPVRAQSGLIRIINEGEELVEQLFPTDAMSRPVRVVRVVNSVVEWQGFLNPEAYDQRYVGFPVELELPVVSTLGAMDAIELYDGFDGQFVTILTHIAYAFGSLNRKCGVNNWFGNIYFPNRYYAALRDCKLYQNFCWSAEEIINQENVTVDVQSVSCKELLRIIAQFFGCVVREEGRNIFITDVQNGGGARSYQYTSYSNLTLALIDHVTPLSVTAYTVSTNTNMASLRWLSENHKKSIQQGARRVRIAAGLKDFEREMHLPAIPYGNLVQGMLDTTVYANTNDAFYSLVTYKYIKAQIYQPMIANGEPQAAFSLSKISNPSTLPYSYLAFWATNYYREHYADMEMMTTMNAHTTDLYFAAFLSIWTDEENVEHNGLMVCGFTNEMFNRVNPDHPYAFNRFALAAADALFTQKSQLIFAATKGWLNINASISMFNGCLSRKPVWPIMDYIKSKMPALTLSLKFGNKYWNGSAWVTTFSTFMLEFDAEGQTASNKTENMDTKEENGYFIPITSLMVGSVELKVYHELRGWIEYKPQSYTFLDAFMEVLVEKMDIRYITPDSIVLSNRTVNNYAQVTGANFDEEKKVSLDLATDLYNDVWANMLYDSNGETVKLLSLDNVNVRPEVDLLNRMTAYYAATRRRLTIDVWRPISAPMPAIQLNGYNDGKKYLPLAESRDWEKEISTLTCFETVNA